jgi:hypothetical protein
VEGERENLEGCRLLGGAAAGVDTMPQSVGWQASRNGGTAVPTMVLGREQDEASTPH